MESKNEKWLIEKRTVYSLHNTGKFKNGEPEQCNKFWFNVQPDHGRGITDEMATEQAKRIHTIINNYDELLKQTAELKEAIKHIILWGKKTGKKFEFTTSLEYLNDLEKLVK